MKSLLTTLQPHPNHHHVNYCLKQIVIQVIEVEEDGEAEAILEGEVDLEIEASSSNTTSWYQSNRRVNTQQE